MPVVIRYTVLGVFGINQCWGDALLDFLTSKIMTYLYFVFRPCDVVRGNGKPTLSPWLNMCNGLVLKNFK